MTIIWSGIEYTYENLEGIGYSSERMLYPYETWLYLRNADCYEGDIFDINDNSIRLFDNSVKEDFVVTEDYTTQIGKYGDENIRLSDNYYRNVDYNKKDTFDITDVYYRIVDKISKEATRITDKSKRDFNNLVFDAFGLTDKSKRNFDILKKESTTLTDKSKRDFDIHTFMNKFWIDNPRYYDAYIDDESETHEINDISNIVSDATIFDLEVLDNAATLDEFNDYVDKNAPLGYNEMRPFYPGEYEYKDAYVGFTLSIPPTNGRFGVIGSKVYADVEDVVEKGTVTTISGQMAQITFTKRFYTIPHIQVSVIYAEGNVLANPVVTEISRSGFKVGIKNLSTTNLLAGEVSWLADGY